MAKSATMTRRPPRSARLPETRPQRNSSRTKTGSASEPRRSRMAQMRRQRSVRKT
jgi:hypothetical protein